MLTSSALLVKFLIFKVIFSISNFLYLEQICWSLASSRQRESTVYQSSQYAAVLNISRLRICFLFCIYQGSKYARDTEGSEDAYTLLMFKYVWICQNMREYTFICLNGFCFKFLHCNLFRLFSWGDKNWFFLKQLRVFDLLFV